MLKFISSVCAAAMAVSLPLATPAMAMPMPAPEPVVDRGSVIQVQRSGRDQWRGGQRGSQRYDRGRGLERRGNYTYYRGHRGHRQYRPGYRRHGDFWFPPAAFIAGAIIGGAISGQQQPPVQYRPVNAHVDWCYARYRSYRAGDNTFQPYQGPRRQCISPYS